VAGLFPGVLLAIESFLFFVAVRLLPLFLFVVVGDDDNRVVVDPILRYYDYR